MVNQNDVRGERPGQLIHGVGPVNGRHHHEHDSRFHLDGGRYDWHAQIVCIESLHRTSRSTGDT
ncbi:MAG: hypothetical protein AMXMBFR6_25140 [Betaproteobacteria bacterium]